MHSSLQLGDLTAKLENTGIGVRTWNEGPEDRDQQVVPLLASIDNHIEAQRASRSV